ncbi:MAG: VWA domain-containing protein, partial [Chloroflexota bacterium]|nr:VWA domain-containing protein [Chloroflexota bacterium]
MNDFVFLQPQTLWLAPALVFLLLLSIRMVRGLAPWRKRTAAFFQTLTVLLLVASLAQPAFARPQGDMSMVVVLDTSASVSPESREQATSFARNVLNNAGEDVTLQFVSVGQRATQLTGEEVLSGEWSSITGTNSLVEDPNLRATDLSSGLRLAGSLLKDEGRRRVVVVSDGWETLGRAADEALRLQSRGIDVQVMPLSALGSPEVIVRSLDVDPYARVGDPVRTGLNVYSSDAGPAVLSLSVDGQPLLTQDVTLKAGENTLPLDHRALTPGFHRLDATITSDKDTSQENNSAAATIVVKSAPNVLVLEDRPGESDRLVDSLLNSQMTVDVRAPAFIPARLPDLDQYDSIVLYNVAATSMTLDQQRTLQEYVRRSGKGLVAIGGQTSFAKGGYQDSVLEEVMPVSSDPGPRPEKGETALILIFDRSSSMDEWMGLSNQDTKFSMAKEAARLSIDALRAGDIFGVLSFDTENLWTIEPVTIHANTDKQALKDRITNIELGGGTSIYPAVEEAGNRILKIQAQSRHLVLMTDGKDYHQGTYDDIIGKLRAANISLSTIAVGSDSDRDLLVDLARKGEGRHYFTERIDNIPKIVFRELDLALKEAIIEGAVQPHVLETSPVLRGIAPGSLPQLGGYDITTPKDASVTALTADLGQPLLAHWNYGLGRVLAFTSSVD